MHDGLMYGKHFASMYGGSMYGKPAIVFAVWGYVISHFRPSRKDGQCYVELHPGLLAGTFSTTPDEVLGALEILEAPDPASQSKAHEGRRLILLSSFRGVGPLHYLVVNGAKYRAIRDEEDRREYLKEAKRISRAKDAETSSTMSTTVNHGQPPSTQAEAEAEAEAEADPEEEALASLVPAPTKKPRPQKPLAERAGTLGDFARLWAARYGGVSPSWSRGECVAINSNADSRGSEPLREAFGRFTQSDDPFVIKARHSPSLFLAQLDRWLVPEASPARVATPEEVWGKPIGGR